MSEIFTFAGGSLFLVFIIGGVKALHTKAKNDSTTEADEKFWALVLQGLKLVFRNRNS